MYMDSNIFHPDRLRIRIVAQFWRPCITVDLLCNRHAGIEAQSASNGVHSFAVRRASIPAVHWVDLGQLELHYFPFSRTVICSPERSSHMS